MNLRELEDFLETQEISFTSILKATKNLDPVELKCSLNRHHAQMIKIAAAKYPLKGIAELSALGVDAEFIPVPGGGHAMLDHIGLWQRSALDFVGERLSALRGA